MNRNLWKWSALSAALIVSIQVIRPQETGSKPSSYAPVDIHETFAAIVARQHAPDDRVFLLDQVHRRVDVLADAGQLGAVLDVLPARFGRLCPRSRR